MLPRAHDRWRRGRCARPRPSGRAGTRKKRAPGPGARLRACAPPRSAARARCIRAAPLQSPVHERAGRMRSSVWAMPTPLAAASITASASFTVTPNASAGWRDAIREQPGPRLRGFGRGRTDQGVRAEVGHGLRATALREIGGRRAEDPARTRDRAGDGCGSSITPPRTARSTPSLTRSTTRSLTRSSTSMPGIAREECRQRRQQECRANDPATSTRKWPVGVPCPAAVFPLRRPVRQRLAGSAPDNPSRRA